jgi:hypothetical protein
MSDYTTVPQTAEGEPPIRYWMTDGISDLDVTVAADADLDGEFTAICNDTGERLLVRGWLIEEMEVLS